MDLIKLFSYFTIVCLMAFGSKANGQSAQTPSVVVSIKPLHSLVAGVMKGVGEPHLLLNGASSPHHFQLKPSQAIVLSRADLVVWVGPLLETPLQKSLSSLAKKGASLELMSVTSVDILERRLPHHHDLDPHDKHEKHDEHEEHEEHGEHEAHKDHEDLQDHDRHHNEGLNDPHIWLSVKNAISITKAVNLKLSKLYPEHAKRFDLNAHAQIKRLEELQASLKQQLSGLGSFRYMVFHDAYNYLTSPFGLKFEGALSVNPGALPSAKHLKQLREKLSHNNVSCVFAEPQYSRKLLDTLVEGTKTKIARLDPIGVDVPPGPDAYEKIMTKLGDDLATCIKP